VCKKFWRALAIKFETPAAGLPSSLKSSSRSFSHPTMDPSCAKGISDLVNTKFGWKQDKLVFSLGIDSNKQIEFNVVPCLGTALAEKQDKF
jgi:hypothetical protein